MDAQVKACSYSHFKYFYGYSIDIFPRALSSWEDEACIVIKVH